MRRPCLLSPYHYIRLPNHIITPHHQGKGIVVCLSFDFFHSMNSDWWLQTIWMKTTPQWWSMSMMSTTTPLFLTGQPMRHKSQRRMTEICPKGCSRLLLHESGVSLEAFSRVLSPIFLWQSFCFDFLFFFLICMFRFVFSLIWLWLRWMAWTRRRHVLWFVSVMSMISHRASYKTPTMQLFLKSPYTDSDPSSR